MKLERSDIDFPVWRKKVDATILKNGYTPIPGWVMKFWNIELQYGHVTQKKHADAAVTIIFKNISYSGHVVKSARSEGRVLYRLFLSQDLCEELQKVYVMSYMRSIEAKLREIKSYTTDVEKDISFWEFLDIEYDEAKQVFYFTAYYLQQPTFPELFNSLVKSTVLKQFECDEDLEFIKSDWLPRAASAQQFHANNVIYYLIDTERKLFYVGEAERMHKRFEQGHFGIKNWDFFRYDILNKTLAYY